MSGAEGTPGEAADAADDLAAEADGRPAWGRFRAALDAEGFRPSRRLGQNFLLDENLARAIVRDAGVGPGDTVLEVGAGCGFLSLHLARAGVRLLAVEIDPRLYAVAGRFLADEPSVRLIHADVLAGKHRLAPEVQAGLPEHGDWHLVGNLPYSVSAPLIAVLSDLENPPASMTVMVQHEVGERLLARPGTSDWGPLGVRLGLSYGGERLRSVPANLFWPRPRVESAVVRLARLPVIPGREEREAVCALARRLFQRRRQTLGRVLGEILEDRERARALLEGLGVDPRARAEGLTLEQLSALARALPG